MGASALDADKSSKALGASALAVEKVKEVSAQCADEKVKGGALRDSARRSPPVGGLP